MDGYGPRPPCLGWTIHSSGDEGGRPALTVDAGGSPRTLPIRITHHARSVHEDTRLSANLSRGRLELHQSTTFTVRHGTLGVLEVRVPPAIADGWELVDHEVIDQEELSREAAIHSKAYSNPTAGERASL